MTSPQVKYESQHTGRTGLTFLYPPIINYTHLYHLTEIQMLCHQKGRLGAAFGQTSI
jgi:hypothetical protein